MTALDTAPAIVRDLFIDSLLFLKVLPQRRPLAVVDIGAGAGIPGLPMRLADPALTLCLVESRRKRVSFLRTVCRELGLADVAVVEGRAEQIVQEDPALNEVFDVAVSRAVGQIDRLSSVALPYLRPGGALIVSASPDGHGSAGVDLVTVPTPGTRGSRRFLTIKK
jgi:16S rRNA (guanine527-N7)-methyltransferase